MARANAAYYARKNPFRDFTTAPEVAQMFGELIGAWCAVVWEGLGRPAPLRLVEAGPGRGTLMADLRRATARVAPAFHAASAVHLIETSPRLRAEQASHVPDATWHQTLEQVPSGPALVLANEFLDALPIRQFERTGEGWAERFVDGGRFRLCPAVTPPPDAAGALVEVAEAGAAWVASLTARLAAEGGAALLIDYGYETPPGRSTLQALRNGRPADPLLDPGEADLTALVDWASLANRSAVAVHGPVPMGAFLLGLGLRARTARLAAANADAAPALAEAADRLVSPGRMGAAFQVMGLGALPLPGFEG